MGPTDPAYLWQAVGFTFLPDSEVRGLLTQRQNQLNNHLDQNLQPLMMDCAPLA